MMRFAAIDAETGGPARIDIRNLPPGSSPPDPVALPNSDKKQKVKWMYVPRIKCTDCPSKLYNAVPPPEDTAGKFEVHLTNSKHRAAVRERLTGARRSGSVGGGPSS